ncbi:hypothetical protein K1719_046214 [Acacia pycnantha]|nr:hypothetical protein K1719_046214 [Acacia pycnantha]
MDMLSLLPDSILYTIVSLLPFKEAEFSLKLSKPSEFSDTVQRCIAFAFQRGVRQLELDLSEPAWEEDDNDDKEGGDVNQVASFRLPSDIYGYYNNNGGSRSLENLKLFSCEFSLSDLMNNFVGLNCFLVLI